VRRRKARAVHGKQATGSGTHGAAAHTNADELHPGVIALLVLPVVDKHYTFGVGPAFNLEE